jgi:transcription termination/antitermination protein NusA
MGLDLISLLGQIGKDKGIDKQILIDAVESAMLSAARKHYGHNLNLEAKFDEDSGEVEVVLYRNVVDALVDDATEILLKDAKVLDPDARVGDELGQLLETKELGRIAAQTAKQVIAQKLRDAERGVIFEEFKESKGSLINGIVQRYDRGNVVVNLGRTEAILPRREQIQRERYRQGDRIRCLILDVDPSLRGPQIILTRSHPDFLAKLFENEVSEIAEGVIEIKGVAREPGDRAKVAVYSHDGSVDPVGACVGVRGSRVLAVKQELRGEKVDIVTWTPDDPSYVARALSPAEVTRVVVDEDNRSMEVIVNDDQLSLAIGRRGQNVKLASKLTGWKLDVRSVSAAEEEGRKARVSLESISDIGFTEVELLLLGGYSNVKEVADATAQDISNDIEGISLERAQILIEGANSVISRNGGFENERLTDVHRLVLPPSVRDVLIENGFSSIQKLLDAEDEELLRLDVIDDQELQRIRSSVETFLNRDRKSA